MFKWGQIKAHSNLRVELVGKRLVLCCEYFWDYRDEEWYLSVWMRMEIWAWLWIGKENGSDCFRTRYLLYSSHSCSWQLQTEKKWEYVFVHKVPNWGTFDNFKIFGTVIFLVSVNWKTCQNGYLPKEQNHTSVNKSECSQVSCYPACIHTALTHLCASPNPSLPFPREY